jgi:hypothetical protein
MSDETPPTPLRLRARPRPESETPPAAAAEGEEGKLRLKPKLSADPEPEAPVEAPPGESEPPVETPRLKPKLTLEPEPEPVAEEAPAEAPPEPEAVEEVPPPVPEEGRVKLKIKLPGAVAQEAAAPVEAEAEPPSLPPFPVVAPPPPEDGEAGAPPLLAEPSAPPFPGAPVATATPVPVSPPGGSRPAVYKRPRVPAALLAAERRKRMWKYALIAVGGIVLAVAVIGGAYTKFTPPPPTQVPPRPTYIAPVELVVKPPPEKTPAPVTPLPIGPATGERVASTATVELAPGVTATTESIRAVPNASPEFRSFVANVKISGVYSGNPPRAFINGRLFRTGEMVDDAQEIYFDSIDAASRSLVFKDSRGTTVSRRY